MHYGCAIAASNISPQQTAAHHAYYGGRIELLKQGFLENCSLHVYDNIASAYPTAMVDFPSLAGGEWINRTGAEPPADSLSELRAAVEAACCMSMFKIRFQFPTYEKYDPDARKAVFIPFYPLPYRDKRGGISSTGSKTSTLMVSWVASNGRRASALPAMMRTDSWGEETAASSKCASG